MNKKEYIKRKTRGKKYINHELCSTCLISCCQKSGCDAIPLDITPFTPKKIIESIDKGIYSISYTLTYEKKVIPILRSREKGVGVFHFSDKHTSCSLLGECGCILDEDERPTLALLLIPRRFLFCRDERDCKLLVKTKEFIKMWQNVTDVMEEVVKHYSKGKSFKTIFIEHRDCSEYFDE